MSTTPLNGAAPVSRDYVVNALVWTVAGAAAIVTVAVQASLGAAYYGVVVWAAMLIAAVQAAGVLVALVRPTIGVALALLAMLAFGIVAEPLQPWPVPVMTMIAYALTVLLVSMRTGWMLGVIAAVCGAVGALAVGLAVQHPTEHEGAMTADLIVFAALCAAAVLIGVLVHSWRVVRAQLAQERAVSAAELVRREAAEQRTELARELHDVVAHGMSAIQVQASSAKYRVSGLSEEAAAEFDEIAALARASMREMRALLAVLRNEDATGAGVPQPTVGDVSDLVAAAGRSGARIELDDRLTGPERAGLDPVASLTAYRVVQESLSNVARHATGADTLVTLELLDGVLRVQVRNAALEDRAAGAAAIGAGEGEATHLDAGGNGIRGMRERVGLLGGTLEAQHTDDGGFVVRAAIPVPGPKGGA